MSGKKREKKGREKEEEEMEMEMEMAMKMDGMVWCVGEAKGQAHVHAL